MMFPTRRYEVSCRETGLCYGVYPGDDAFDAACNFYDDAGYATPGKRLTQWEWTWTICLTSSVSSRSSADGSGPDRPVTASRGSVRF